MKTENRFRFYLGKQRLPMRQNTELEQPDSHGVEWARAGQRFESGTVVGMNEQFGWIQAGGARKSREEAAPLFRGEGGVFIRAGKMSVDSGETKVLRGEDLGT